MTGNEVEPTLFVGKNEARRSLRIADIRTFHPRGSRRPGLLENNVLAFGARDMLQPRFEVFPILANGSLGPAVFQQKDIDNVGPKVATNAPPGSFAISAHEGPNGHPQQMEADPSNEWVLGPDAGQDRIYVWKLTLGATPPLAPAAVPS
jgi:hypothetical protein